MRLARIVLASAVSAALITGVLVAPAAAEEVPAAPADPAALAARELRADNAVDPTIKTEDGLLRTVTAQAGHPLNRPDSVPAAAPAETVARAFLDDYGQGFGLADGDTGLTTTAVTTAAGGDRIVRLQQRVGGVPVIGGDFVVSTDATGHVLTTTGEVTQDTADPGEPRVTAGRAIREAIEAAAAAEQAPADTLRGDASRWMYDPELVGAPGVGLRQVWRVEIEAREGDGPQRLVLVDATLGEVVLNLDLHAHAKQRYVCDYTNVGVSFDPTCSSGSSKMARSEGGVASSVADVNKAYDYSGATYDFYSTNFGRNSIDGAGMPLRSSVRVCFTGDTCPYQNAYWDGEKMVFGGGFASADDVVAHELTHGVTEHTANLFYAYQSGAINESLSDIMGEFVDQQYAGGTTDGAQYDWLMGEDLPSSIGVIRNMANPGQFGDPDRMTSSNYVGETHFGDIAQPDDSGGVHSNSGVGNKAAYLITAPGTRTFNGVTVTGIGIPKAAQVYYRAMSLLTSGSDYADLAAALDAACASLVTGAVAGITVDDCAQVTAATTAVEMTYEPVAAAAKASDVDRCPTGQTLSLDASDGFENGLGGWTVTGNFYDGFSYVTGYARSGTRSMYAQTGDSAATLQQTATWAALTLPEGRSSYLWFAHAYDFDTRSGTNRDGGRVQYRVGAGAWTDASALLTGGYTGDLSGTAGTGAAFTGESHGYRSTRMDLSSFAGSSVQLRFVTLADATYASDWRIDDVQVYGCAVAGTSVAGLSAVAGAPGAVTLSWTALDGASSYTVDGPATGLPVTVTDTQLALSGLNPATSYTFTVTPALDQLDQGSATAVTVRRTAVSLTAPAATITAGGGTTMTGVVTVVGGGTPSGSVALSSRRKGTSTWAVVATATVGSTGAFTFAQQKPVNSTEYRAQTTGGVNQLSNTSAVVSVGVAPVVTVKALASTVRAGGTVWFTGTTKPVHAYATTMIQIYYGGAWRTVATTKTYSGGNFGIAAKLTTRGRWAYRAAVSGDNNYAFASSGNVMVTVS